MDSADGHQHFESIITKAGPEYRSEVFARLRRRSRTDRECDTLQQLTARKVDHLIMLEPDQWDSALGTLTGVQFRGTERIASATILNALGVAHDREARQKAGKRIVTAMRRLGWQGPRTMRINEGVSVSGYWRLPCKPPGSRAAAEPFDGEVLTGDLPEQLEQVTRLGLKKLARILRTPVDLSDGNLLRSQVTAAGIAMNAQLRADEQRLKAKVQGDVLGRLLAAIEKERARRVAEDGGESVPALGKATLGGDGSKD